MVGTFRNAGFLFFRKQGFIRSNTNDKKAAALLVSDKEALKDKDRD